MALFVTVSEGRAGTPTQPIVASSDPRVIRAVVDAIVRYTVSPSSAGLLRPLRGRRPVHREEAEVSK